MADEKIYTNVGHATAYAYAKSKGYTGTEDQFATDQANFAANAQQVREDKESVEATVATFDNTTVPAAVQTVTAEGTRQVGIVGTAGDTQVARVQAEGTTQVGVVQTEGTTQKNAVQAKGNEVIASIPSDYTELTEEVEDLKSSLGYEGVTWELGNVYDNGSLSDSTKRIRTNDYIEAYKNEKILTKCTASNGIYVKVVMYSKSGDTYTKIGDVIATGLLENNTSYTLTIPQHCYIRVCAYYRYEPTITDDSKAALTGMISIPNYSTIVDIDENVQKLLNENEQNGPIIKNAAISANGDENTTVGNNIRWLEKNFIVPENYDRLTDKTAVANSTINSSGDIISGSYLAFEQYIKVDPNKTYYCNNITYFGAVRGYDASKTVVSNGVSVSGKQLTTGEGVYFVRISVNSEATPANVTFQLGTSATDAPLVFNGDLNGFSVADFNNLKDTAVAEVLSTDWTIGALNDNGSTSESDSRIYTTNHIKMLSGMRIIVRAKYNNGIYVKVLTEKLTVDGESYKKIDVIYSQLIENGVQATISIPYDCYVRIQMYYKYEPTITTESKAALINMIHIMNSSILNHLSDRIAATEENIGYKPPDDFILENRDLQNNNTLLFAWTSDTHHQIHGASEFGMTKEKLAEFAQVANAVRCDYLTITGDIVNGYYPVVEQKTNLARLVNTIRDNCELPALLVEGNHDDNSWYASANGSAGTEYTGLDEVLQNDQFTNYSMNNSIETVVFNPVDPLGGYYYKDFKKTKIRVIMLNTADIPYIENLDKSLVYNGQSTFAFMQNQLNWLANTALKFTENGWGVILMMHYDSNMTDNTTPTHNADNLNDIMDAFQSKTSGTTTSTDGDFALSVSYDFTQNASDDVIAWFSGHRHDDKDEIIDGIPHVRIINPWNATGGGFDIVTVDRVAKKIYTKRYNGEPMPTYDREIDYGS